MFDKQLGRAAAEGRRVTFIVNIGGFAEVSGYVTGMDAYNVMVMVPDEDDAITWFVHKGLAPFTKFSPTETLDGEPEAVQEAVRRVGERFWQTCRERYLGHHTTSQESAS